MKGEFSWDILEYKDSILAQQIVGDRRDPDTCIVQDGVTYYARWHLVKQPQVNVWLHVQTASDPSATLHTHPWDNTSVYLAGKAIEDIHEGFTRPTGSNIMRFFRKPGDVVHRKAGWAHTVTLDTPYVMTIFTTGPAYRKRGYWQDGAPPPNYLLP